ncbi:MAG: translation elongation factor Ts [Candidatus Caldatribacteriota bacterium]|jgi:elongation factor Ts|nr:translation elongation factor Ts [Atribacterota bacterium]MDD3031047.1 translation elongation factor Ts [Atribacterota bacterium]MDD3640212.1 translation elongation factor Ts [Atribacterota bacterium]MDD4288514.1 translation elongation factor Ts [Atribacterota bacterium]MDD4764248.1 translation elongation factor Ts [Atribacterota bacterium]
MNINAKLVKELRDKTGAGMMDCKKALTHTEGDFEKAIDYLRKKGIQSASSKVGRSASNGIITSYIHLNGKVGVLLEINCETDFVAKTPEFNELAKNITLQIAAANPMYVKREEVPEEIINKEKEVYYAQAENLNKPQKVLDSIVEGKINKYYSEICLLEQPYIREPEKKVNQLVLEAISKLKENIVVKRFVRYQLGE